MTALFHVRVYMAKEPRHRKGYVHDFTVLAETRFDAHAKAEKHVLGGYYGATGTAIERIEVHAEECDVVEARTGMYLSLPPKENER